MTEQPLAADEDESDSSVSGVRPRPRIGCLMIYIVAVLLGCAFALWAGYRIIRPLLPVGSRNPEYPALAAGTWSALDPSSDTTVTLTLAPDGLAAHTGGVLQLPTLWHMDDVEQTSWYIGAPTTLTGTLYLYDHDSWTTYPCKVRIESSGRPAWDGVQPLSRTLRFETGNGSWVEDALNLEWTITE